MCAESLDIETASALLSLLADAMPLRDMYMTAALTLAKRLLRTCPELTFRRRYCGEGCDFGLMMCGGGWCFADVYTTEQAMHADSNVLWTRLTHFSQRCLTGEQSAFVGIMPLLHESTKGTHDFLRWWRWCSCDQNVGRSAATTPLHRIGDRPRPLARSDLCLALVCAGAHPSLALAE